MRETICREDIQSWLMDWFRTRDKVDGHGGPRIDIDYFHAGWLTSMEVVEFITEIESHFDMQFSDQDMQDSRFVTIAGLSELIERRAQEDACAHVASAQIKESR
jgi:acyl carrier protein